MGPLPADPIPNKEKAKLSGSTEEKLRLRMLNEVSTFLGSNILGLGNMDD